LEAVVVEIAARPVAGRRFAVLGREWHFIELTPFRLRDWVYDEL